MSARLGSVAGYGALLAVTALFWLLAGRIDVPARPGQLGPDFWPKAALALMGAVCVVQIARALLAGRQAIAGSGIEDRLEAAEADGDEEPRRPALLLGGIVLVVMYGVVIETLGFPLSTALFMVAFMYLGGSRAHGAIWLSSLLGTALVSVLLLRVVYVSLPRGTAPFDRITDLITSAF